MIPVLREQCWMLQPKLCYGFVYIFVWFCQVFLSKFWNFDIRYIHILDCYLVYLLYPFTFSLYMSLCLQCISYRLHSIQSDNLCLVIGVFWLLTFNVIISMVKLQSAILLFVFYSPSSFSALFPLLLLNGVLSVLGISLSARCPGKNSRAYLICFTSLGNHSLVLLVAQCLKTGFTCLVQFSSFLQKENVSSPSHAIMVQSYILEYVL